MNGQTVQLEQGTSWQRLKERSARLGIPAWKLAEEQAFHTEDIKKRSQKS